MKAITATTIARLMLEIIIIRLGERRSLSAPPKSIKKARGIAPTMRTVPNAKPEPVI